MLAYGRVAAAHFVNALNFSEICQVSCQVCWCLLDIKAFSFQKVTQIMDKPVK